MAGLGAARPIVVVCTKDRTRATAFYRDTLGLTLTSEDHLAIVFDVGGTALHIATVADFTPHEHTILGFKVSDVAAAVIGLRERGVLFNILPGFKQDHLGILTVPGTAVRVAWFKDPEGNVLSVTDA
jgi:predicted enzyme related to lactoylglutathione lyase